MDSPPVNAADFTLVFNDFTLGLLTEFLLVTILSETWCELSAQFACFLIVK